MGLSTTRFATTARRTRRRAVPILVTVLTAAPLHACAFRRLKSDIQSAEQQMTLHLKVDMADEIAGDIIGVVYTPYHESQRVSAFKKIDPKVKATLFVMEKGDYRVALFHDKNRNLVINDDEPSTLLNRGRRLPFSDVTIILNPNHLLRKAACLSPAHPEVHAEADPQASSMDAPPPAMESPEPSPAPTGNP